MKPLAITLSFVAWTLIIFLSLYFLLDVVMDYLKGLRSPLWGESFFNNRLWVYMHFAGGSLALVLGPLQFGGWIRKWSLPFHRTCGKLYLAGIVLIGISAGRLSLISSCIPCRVSLFLLTILAVLSAFFSWQAIRRRNIKTHRQMMVRSYICVLSFVMVRLEGILPLELLFGAIENSVYRRVVNEYFFSFVPLIIAEIIMVWWPSVHSNGSGECTGMDAFYR